jgi:hypothetical protein
LTPSQIPVCPARRGLGRLEIDRRHPIWYAPAADFQDKTIALNNNAPQARMAMADGHSLDFLHFGGLQVARFT